MADPALAPDGSTVFPATGSSASRRPASPRRRSSARRSTTFELGLSADGHRHRRRRRRRSGRSPSRGSRPRSRPVTSSSPDSTKVDVGEAIGRPARRSASRSRRPPTQIAVLDPEQLKAMVLGKRIDEARAILAPFGQVAAERLARLDRVRAELRQPGHVDDRPGCPDRDAGPSAPRRPRRRDAAGDQPSGELDPVTRLLGIDLGERRIGLALADDDGSARDRCRPLRRGRDLDADVTALAAVVAAQRDRCAGRRSAARGHRATRARMAVQTRAWGDAIRERLDLPLSFRDERLSSHLAEARLGPDEARTFRRPTKQDPARRLSCPGRSGGCRDHPPGRARHTSRRAFVHATTPGPPGDATDDDPLRRTPAGPPRHERPAVRSRRLRDRIRSPSTPSRSRARAAAGTVAAAGTGWSGS